MAGGPLNINAQTRAPFVSTPTQVIVGHGANRDPAQHHIAIRSAAPTARFAKTIVIRQLLREKLPLIEFRNASFKTYDFLQGDNISVEFTENFHYASRIDLAIQY